MLNLEKVSQQEEQGYWDDIAGSFNRQGQHGLWRRHSDRVNCKLLEDWLPDHDLGRLLKTDLFDEAISEGLYPFLSARCRRMDGIDISQKVVDASLQKYPELKAHLADLRDLPFEDRAFDCVVSTSSLDHFQQASDIDKALQELFRITIPGGYLLITMDNLQNPAVYLRNNLPASWLQKAGLVPYFTGRSLNRAGLNDALQRAGFETLESTAVMHCPRAIAVARASAVLRKGDVEAEKRFLTRLQGWERFRNWPTRYFTGYYVAVRARRPAEQSA